jgi:hypothetical protein
MKASHGVPDVLVGRNLRPRREQRLDEKQL